MNKKIFLIFLFGVILSTFVLANSFENGLLAYWNFDNKSLTDSWSGNYNLVAYPNIGVFSNAPAYYPPNWNTTYSFGNAVDYELRINGTDGIVFPREFTFCIWMNFTDYSYNEYWVFSNAVFQMIGGSATGIEQTRWAIGNPAPRGTVFSAIPAIEGTYHQYCIEQSPERAQMVLDGVLQNYSTIRLATSTTKDMVWFGGTGNEPRQAWDESMFWSRILSPNELSLLYQQNTQGKFLGAWNSNECVDDGVYWTQSWSKCAPFNKTKDGCYLCDACNYQIDNRIWNTSHQTGLYTTDDGQCNITGRNVNIWANANRSVDLNYGVVTEGNLKSISFSGAEMQNWFILTNVTYGSYLGSNCYDSSLGNCLGLGGDGNSRSFLWSNVPVWGSAGWYQNSERQFFYNSSLNYAYEILNITDTSREDYLSGTFTNVNNLNFAITTYDSYDSGSSMDGTFDNLRVYPLSYMKDVNFTVKTGSGVPIPNIIVQFFNSTDSAIDNGTTDIFGSVYLNLSKGAGKTRGFPFDIKIIVKDNSDKVALNQTIYTGLPYVNSPVAGIYPGDSFEFKTDNFTSTVTILYINVSPQYPEGNTNLTCGFNFTFFNDSYVYNATISWYNSTNNVNYNIVSSELIIGITNKSNYNFGVLPPQPLGSYWRCEVNITQNGTFLQTGYSNVLLITDIISPKFSQNSISSTDIEYNDTVTVGVVITDTNPGSYVFAFNTTGSFINETEFRNTTVGYFVNLTYGSSNNTIVYLLNNTYVIADGNAYDENRISYSYIDILMPASLPSVFLNVSYNVEGIPFSITHTPFCNSAYGIQIFMNLSIYNFNTQTYEQIANYTGPIEPCKSGYNTSRINNTLSYSGIFNSNYINYSNVRLLLYLNEYDPSPGDQGFTNRYFTNYTDKNYFFLTNNSQYTFLRPFINNQNVTFTKQIPQVDNWCYQVWANDSLGNTNVSQNYCYSAHTDITPPKFYNNSINNTGVHPYDYVNASVIIIEKHPNKYTFAFNFNGSFVNVSEPINVTYINVSHNLQGEYAEYTPDAWTSVGGHQYPYTHDQDWNTYSYSGNDGSGVGSATAYFNYSIPYNTFNWNFTTKFHDSSCGYSLFIYNFTSNTWGIDYWGLATNGIYTNTYNLSSDYLYNNGTGYIVAVRHTVNRNQPFASCVAYFYESAVSYIERVAVDPVMYNQTNQTIAGVYSYTGNYASGQGPSRFDDGDWSTTSHCDAGSPDCCPSNSFGGSGIVIWKNYTLAMTEYTSDISLKVMYTIPAANLATCYVGSTLGGNVYFSIQYWNYVSGDWTTIFTDTATSGWENVTVTIPRSYIYPNTDFRIRVAASGRGGYGFVYIQESEISYEYNVTPSRTLYFDYENNQDVGYVTQIPSKPNFCYQVWANDDYGNENVSANYCYGVSGNSTITYTYPPNNYINNLTYQSFCFNVSDGNPNPIDKCTLWTNYTGLWQPNVSNSSYVFKNEQNCIIWNNLYKAETYKWNIQCNDTSGNYAFNNTNYSLSIVDATPPIVQDIKWITLNGDNGTTLMINETLDYINASCTDANLYQCKINIYNADGMILNNGSMNLVSGDIYEYNTNILINRGGTWIINVTGYDSSGNYGSSSSSFFVITTPPLFGAYSTTETAFSPQIDEDIGINISVISTFDRIEYCNLVMNDTGIWQNKTPEFINCSSCIVNINYTIQNYSIKNMSTIGWRMQCNDTSGNLNVSDIYTFVVKDITTPYVYFSGGNSFNDKNTTSISSYLSNVTLNISFFDNNLFAAEVNITCENDGQIYYWSITDINTTYYTLNDTVDISGKPLQKCSVFISSSDDHTKKKIEDYTVVKTNDGVAFKTSDALIGINYVIVEDSLVNNGNSNGNGNGKGNGNGIGKGNEIGVIKQDWKTEKLKIKENIDDKKDSGFIDNLINPIENINIENVEAVKNIDRYTFTFEEKDSSTKHQFIVTSDTDVYPRYNSKYPGHIVMWNKETKHGNWIDFNNPNVESSNIECEETDCLVTLYTKLPTDIIEFQSIGGTNVVNVSYLFYIGGAVNVSTLNLYDNASTVGNFNVSIFSINSTVFVNETVSVVGNYGYLGNLSNGTYYFTFTKPGWFSQTYIVTVNDTLQAQVWQTAQGIVNFYLRNIKTLADLDNYNVTINNTLSNTQTFGYTGSTVLTMYVNASNYTGLAVKEGYLNVTGSFTILPGENKTVILYVPFYGTFTLFDERTLDLFNVSSPSRINFLIFCPDSTFSYIINTTTPSILVNCPYEKFKFVLDYAETSYYRTFMLEPDEVNNYSIYLIDLATTQSVYNGFVIDDLYRQYVNPKIFVKKVIQDKTVQITADSVDIENKVGAYLIYSHQYIVEIHSDNYPVRVLGPYAADQAGTKTIRLYDISAGDIPGSFSNDVNTYGGIINYSGGKYAYHFYQDTANKTSSITWKVYKDSGNGTLLYSTTITNANWTNGVELLYNVTDIYNTTSIYGKLIVDYIGGSEHIFSWVYSFVKVVLGAVTDIKEILAWVGGSSENGAKILQWFMVLLLGMIAIWATIRTANMVAMVLTLFAALLTLFQLFSISAGVLVVGILIAFISLLKSEDRGQEG